MAAKKKIPAKKKKASPKKKKDKVVRKRALSKMEVARLFGDSNAVQHSQDVYTQLAKRYLIKMTAGQPSAYNPLELLKVATEYFTYCKENPLVEEKVFGSGRRMTVNHIRAMSMMGLCVFACLHRSTYDLYKKDKKYLDVCQFIEHTIYMQKFEGAAADLLNHAIIARDLGLVDKSAIVDKNGEAITGFNYIVPTKPAGEDSNEI